jgi:lipopolysaccharide transport system permease protein
MATLVIEPRRTELRYWSDLWRYRELFYVLAWRDVSVRYKQTVIGIAWALLQPILTIAVFTVIFGKLAKMPSDGVPYPLLVFGGMLPWQFFSNALTGSSQSLVNNANLVSKVYFPRLIIPASTVVTSLVDLFVAFLLMLVTMFFSHCLPSWRIIFLPVFALLAFATALGPGLLITAMNVKYRDFRHVLPFLVQLGVYVSPVGFSTAIVPQQWRLLYSLNPMVGLIDGFRWTLLGDHCPLYLPGFLVSLAVAATLLLLGVWYFRRTERTFADII